MGLAYLEQTISNFETIQIQDYEIRTMENQILDHLNQLLNMRYDSQNLGKSKPSAERKKTYKQNQEQLKQSLYPSSSIIRQHLQEGVLLQVLHPEGAAGGVRESSHAGQSLHGGGRRPLGGQPEQEARPGRGPAAGARRTSPSLQAPK